jgi:hypothetical protein
MLREGKPRMWTFAGITCILLLLSLATLLLSPNPWQPVAGLWAAVRGRRVVKGQDDVQVWIMHRSGFYYCSDSKFYGNLTPGGYMRQGEALERGYQPFLQKACR